MNLPQHGPARLLRSLQASDGGRIVGSGGVEAGSPYAVDGQVPAYVALELAAQTAAASHRADAAGSEERIGYVVRVRQFEALLARLPAGLEWRATVCCTGAAGSLTTYDAEVHVGDELVARCAFSTFVPQAE